MNLLLHRGFMKKLSLVSVLALILMVELTQATTAPRLNFSDLISGPDSGIGDSLGEGTIVTIWGNNLGSSQGASKIYFKDSTTTSYEAAYVYYWCNADGGTSGGGPSDLYTYHKMQEIAFSIPTAAASGAGKIYVTVGGVNSNELDFTIRSGDIYWVKTSGDGGSNSNAGTFASPWETIQYAVDATTKITAGGTVYVTDGVMQTTSAIALAIKSGDGSAVAGHSSIVAYPGASVQIKDTDGGSYEIGIANYSASHEYFAFSKLNVVSDETCVQSFNHLRFIGNNLTDDVCATGSSAAIDTRESTCNSMVYYGNTIHDYGCSSTSSLEHTTYFTNRHSLFNGPDQADWLDTDCEAFDFGWNALIDNQSRFGIHVFDEGGCGGWSGTTLIHDNLIKNQVGTAINFTAYCTDSTELPEKSWELSIDANVYNNLIINAGIAQDDGDQYDTTIGMSSLSFGNLAGYATQKGLEGNIDWYNNTIYGYGRVGADAVGEVECIKAQNIQNTVSTLTWSWINNIVVDTRDFPYYYSDSRHANAHWADPSYHSNNIWYNGGDSTPSSAPSWDTSPITTDPLFTNSGSNDFSLQSGSPAKDAGYDTSSVVVADFIGTVRPVNSTVDIGTYEYTTGIGITVTGTALTDFNEDDAVTGGRTLIFTAVNTTWVATIGADNAITTAFLAIFNGSASGAGSWDSEVSLDYTMLTRDSDTQLTLVLPATAGYNPSPAVTETVSIGDIPASATEYGSTITPSPNSFTIGVVSVTTTTSKVGVYNANGKTGVYNANGKIIISGE